VWRTTSVQAATSVLDEIQAARDRHLEAGGELVQCFLRELEAAYEAEIAAFADACRRDLALREPLEPILAATRDYLSWLQWVAWNAANLAPLLGEDLRTPARRLAPAMLSYAGLRLVDDGLDRHDTYKGFHPTVFGWLQARRPHLPVDPGAYSAFLGFCIFAFGLRRTADEAGAAAARDLGRLFEGVVVGALAEPLVGVDCGARSYEQIARRKSAAYNLILYKPLVEVIDPTVRRSLLSVLSEMDVLAQLVNDTRDEGDDRDRQQPNAAVQGLYGNGVSAEIAARLERLWADASSLPDPYRDALAAMFANLGTENA
jgi:hypothetical protein